MTTSDMIFAGRCAPAGTPVSTVATRTSTVPADVCNLLQVAASAFHLLDRYLDDDLRPLVRTGLSAIGQAGRYAHAAPASTTFCLGLGETYE